MKKLVLLILLFFFFKVWTQEQDAWVYFNDKPDAAVALTNPISILTQKAIDRKQNHGVDIDERDVPVHEAYISALKSQDGIAVLAKSKWFNAVHVRGEMSAINLLEGLNFVQYIDFADHALSSANRTIETNAEVNYSRTSEMSIVFDYGQTQNQVEMINVHNLHSAGFTGEGMTIAVMDSGFPNVNTMSAFQRLRANNDLLGGYDFVDRNPDVYASTISSHGTQVLSTMAAYVEDEFVGTAPDATYYLFRTEDALSENPVEESYWVEAAERADSLGVDMINTSLGYSTYDNANYSYTPQDMNGQVAFISKGATIAAEKGILVVVSAGNAGASAWQTVGAPADSPNVLSIGGVDANGTYVSFSSRGGIAQDGYQKPNVVARAGGAYVVTQNNNVVQSNGTSFSSPILCGGIAALWQAIPNMTATEVINIVQESASQFTTPDEFLGYGIPNLDLARNLALTIEDYSVEEITIYPNPVKSTLHVCLPSQSRRIDLIIYNQLGQQVGAKSIRKNFARIDMKDLAAGLYLIQITDKTSSKTFKFIKQ